MSALIKKVVFSCLPWLGISGQSVAKQHKNAVRELLMGKIMVTQTAAFNTTAAYVEGKVINYATRLPVAGATIKVIYSSRTKSGTAVSTKSGKFRVGWVGVGKPRFTQVAATGFQPIERREIPIKDGHSNFLQIELLPLPNKTAPAVSTH